MISLAIVLMLAVGALADAHHHLCPDDDFGGECEFLPGQVWRGEFAKTDFRPELSGEFELVIADHDYALLTNGNQTIFWRFALKGADQVALQDLAAHPAYLACNSDVAHYSVEFGDRCSSATLVALNEPCEVRGKLLGQEDERNRSPVRLERVSCEAPEAQGEGCQLTTPVLLYGQHASVDEHTSGDAFAISIASNHAYIEVQEDGVYFGYAALAEAGDGSFVIHEVGSQEPQLACAHPGHYAWTSVPGSDETCSRHLALEMRTPDMCVDRYERLEGEVLTRIDVCKLEALRAAERQ
eukprot:TRINITY_DN1969_c0_g1_i1.p1 TRINITY_DN1969_c0_g1~~TRINITY_DN1969_c0_g1_i1.p1  ORF type:complete len:312 (-),score=111.35 TRINITY_DN1969_c0_g1_i1:46-936(-)